MQSVPLITVITVVRNGVRFIERTMLSVLGQDYPNIDYIIVDGGSTDGTVDLIRRYDGRLRWISEKDTGIYDAMNKGIRLARGEWINFLNGGDAFIDQTTVSTMFSAGDLSGIKFLYGDSINVMGIHERYIAAAQISLRTLRRHLGLCHQAVFVRRSVCPNYDLRYRYKAEYNWVIDIANNIPKAAMRHVALPVVYYELGGFSEKGMLSNLREFVILTRKRVGLVQAVLNVPVYTRILMRALWYKVSRAPNNPRS